VTATTEHNENQQCDVKQHRNYSKMQWNQSVL